MDQKLPKHNKLKSKQLISKLFSEGEVIKSYPIIMHHLNIENLDTDFQVGFSVSKRNFKLAVDRNRIKRLLRESFRKNKYLFYNKDHNKIMMFLFVGKEMPEQAVIDRKILNLKNKLKLE